MSVDAKVVKELRDKTGLPMMKCKSALSETNGDMEKAIELLRKEGIKAQDKRSDRANDEGILVSASQNNKFVLVEMKCETDFVGKNQDFKDFAAALCTQVLQNGAENILEQKLISNPAITVEQGVQELTLKIGEKISVGRIKVIDGLCGIYVHHDGKQAAMVKLTGEPALKENADVKELLTGICQHIVFTAPKCKSPDEVPADLIEKEKEIYKEEIKDKPENIQSKMLESKVKKFVSEFCLLEQKYIKDNKKSISELVSEVGKGVNTKLTVDDFALVVVGK